MSPFLGRARKRMGRGRPRPSRETPPRENWRPDAAAGPEEYVRLVLRWQEPLYSLARRLLRNDADAADATQEIFSTLLKNLHRYDSKREFQPWLYRVATHVIYQFIRDSRLRREKEQRVAMKENKRSATTDPLEKRELEHVMQHHLAALSQDAQALLVLHYYNGLSQRELARVLEIPRTTVASRLQKALSHLRSHLERSGYVALAPNVEVIMRNAGTLKVPAALSQELLGLGASVVPGSLVASEFTLGGILMTKNITLALVAVALVSLGTGVGMGNVFFASKEPAGKKASGIEVSGGPKEEGEIKALRDTARQLESRLATLAAEKQALEERLANQEALIAQLRAETTRTVASETTDPRQIDWSRLSRLFTENADLLTAFAKIRADGRDGALNLTADQQAELQELMAEWTRAATLAKRESPVPFLDPEVLPELLGAMFAGPLELDEAQLAQLSDASLKLLDQYGELDEPTPLRAYQARAAVADGIRDALDGMLREPQAEAWNAIEAFYDDLLEGGTEKYRFGTRAGDQARAELCDYMKQYYLVDPEHHGRIDEIGARYMKDAGALLERHGQHGRDSAPLSPEEERRLSMELFALQLKVEDRILPYLTEEGRAGLHGKRPGLIQFENSGGINVGVNDYGGF